MDRQQRILSEALRASLDAASAAVLVTRSGKVVRQERFAALFGLGEELLGGAGLETIVASLRGSGAAPVADVLSGGGADDRGEVVLEDGRTFAWQVVDVEGSSERIWVFRDATASRQLALALHDAGNWLRLLEAHLTEAVVLELDDDARIVGIWANIAILTHTDSKLEGVTFVDAIGGPHGVELDARVRRVLATGQAESYEYVLERDGQRSVFVANMIRLTTAEGERPHATVMIRDVTEHAYMQSRLLETEKLASVGFLAAGVAHEINNPLAYTLLNLERIRSGVRVLARGPTAGDLMDAPAIADELLGAVEICLEGCRRVQSIVQDLRRFSRSDDPEGMLVPIDVRRVLEFAADIARPEARRRANVVCDFGQTPMVLGSEVRLAQIFLNLIVNAVHAIPEGAPADNEIRLVTTTDGSGRAVIEVRDTGEGMTPAVMSRIFEPFYTTKPPGLGTGLGLSICRSIAASMGGEIVVESERGRGSIFRVIFPPASVEPDTV
jgi:signal transduction histidine kinase